MNDTPETLAVIRDKYIVVTRFQEVRENQIPAGAGGGRASAFFSA